MRSWARDLGRRLEDSRGRSPAPTTSASLGETVGGLAHNFNNSLAAILAYTELMLRDEPTGTAKRRLTVIRDVALEASATVRRLQEFVSRQPQVAFGPVGLPAVIAEAARDDGAALARRGAAARHRHHGHPGHGGAAARRGQCLRAPRRPRAAHPNAVTAMPRGRRPRHPRRQRGVGLGGRRGEGHRRGHAGGDAAPHRRARAEPGRRAAGRAPGSLEVADIVERHGGSAQHRERERARARPCGCGCTPAASRSSPPPAGSPSGSVRPELAARVLLVDDDPRLAHRALRHAARGGPCRHDRRQRRGGDRCVRSRRRTTWSSPISACPR